MIKPVLSILIPSRGRFNDLIEAIDSFINTATDKNSIEFVLKFDRDDHLSWNRINEIRNDVKTSILVTDRLDGYKSLHTYANYMIHQATGEWIMFSNDDIKILTNGWDDILRNETKSLCCLDPYLLGQKSNDITPTMPIVSREAIKLFGIFAGNHAIDRWLQSIFTGASMKKIIPLTFNHIGLNDDLVKDRGNSEVPDNWDETKELRDKLINILTENTTYIDDDGNTFRIL